MIHPTALIDPKADLAADVQVGAYSLIGAHVQIDAGTVVGPHVVINGPCRIGRNNRIFQFASIGEACQDKKYRGEPTELHIGDDNVIREFVTMQRGTVQDRGLTQVGNRGLFMAYCHVAHDCVLADDVILANATQLAGHVHLGEHVILGGGTLVHQFVQVGAHAMTGAGTVLLKDLPAFVLCQGNPPRVATINSEGLKRRGFSEQDIRQLKQAFRVIYRQSLTLEQALDELTAWPVTPALQTLLNSLAVCQRGLVR